MSHTVTLIHGDGIGKEVISATKKVIDASGVKINWEVCEAGAECFKKGLATGVPSETIESIKKNRVVLKGPLETPVGYGETSANVTLRKLFETFGNVRPIKSLKGVNTPFKDRNIDFVVVRENVEDLYAGIEYQLTPGVSESLKVISRKGCEKIVRLAFELALAEGRKTVHCATKANIMKFSEGLMKRTFEEIAPEYPQIESKHIIIDNCGHQMVKAPEQFDVIVTTNMNGDILSDIGSALIGGLGFAPGANIGNGIAMFEAVHGSAPSFAGKNIANPSAVIFSALMMLRYLGEFEAANVIESAVMYTFQDGKKLTGDIDGVKNPASTTEFTDEVINNLGKKAEGVVSREYKKIKIPVVDSKPDYVKANSREWVGVDVYVESGKMPDELGKRCTEIAEANGFTLQLISNRGMMVYPLSGNLPDLVDSWRCRFLASSVNHEAMVKLIAALGEFPIHSVLPLYKFDGKLGYTKAQGEK